jgi:hypothetical protein
MAAARHGWVGWSVHIWQEQSLQQQEKLYQIRYCNSASNMPLPVGSRQLPRSASDRGCVLLQLKRPSAEDMLFLPNAVAIAGKCQ